MYYGPPHIIHRFWLQFVHPFDWASRSPQFRPNTEHLESIESNKGQKGYTKWNGRIKRKLTYYLLNHFAERGDKLYYHSNGRSKSIVLMLDLDRHQPHQTQEHILQAIKRLNRLFENFGTKIKWVQSDRGANGYWRPAKP